MNEKSKREDAATQKIDSALEELIQLNLGDRTGALSALSIVLHIVVSAMFGVVVAEARRRVDAAKRLDARTWWMKNLNLMVIHQEVCIAAKVIADTLNEAWKMAADEFGISLAPTAKMFIPAIQPSLGSSREVAIGAVTSIAAWAGAQAEMSYGEKGTPLVAAAAAIQVSITAMAAAPDVAATVASIFVPPSMPHADAARLILRRGTRSATAPIIEGVEDLDLKIKPELKDEYSLPVVTNVEQMMVDLAGVRPMTANEWAPPLDIPDEPPPDGPAEAAPAPVATAPGDPFTKVNPSPADTPNGLIYEAPKKSNSHLN